MIAWVEQTTGAEEHWKRIREALPPFKFPPQPPSLFFELTDDEAADMAKFKRLRCQKLLEAAPPP